MTTKVLNLDAFAIEKAITLGGATYAVKQMTVGDFIESAESTQEIADAQDTVKRTKLLIAQISKYVPDISQETLLAMTGEQMFAVLAYIRGEDVQQAPTVEGDAKNA